MRARRRTDRLPAGPWPAPRLRALQVEEAYRALPWVTGYGFAGSLVAFGVLAGLGDGRRMGAWLLCGALVALVRGMAMLFYRRRDGGSDPAGWARLVVATNILAGLQWGVLGTFLFPEGTAHAQLFALMMIVCLVAVAMPAHAAIDWAHEVLTLTAVVPTALYLFFLRDGVHAGAGAGAILLCAMLLVHARQMTLRVRRSLEVAIERDDLAALAGAVHDKLDAERRDLEYRVARIHARHGSSAAVK